MAEKKAKTGEKTGRELQRKHLCKDCGTESHIVLYAGFGRKGLFWVCDKACGYVART